MKPRLLDLFCGAGGAAMGYSRAGFEVVGVDIKFHPHYPFEFHQADAMTYPLEGFDAIHASPPCHDHTPIRRSLDGTGELLFHTLELLSKSGKSWVCENVVGPQVLMRGYFFVLCGSMFDMKVRRHRRFGSSILIFQPDCLHGKQGRPWTITGHGGGCESRHSKKPNAREFWRYLDMPWMEGEPPYGVAQAIPPAYTEFIGRQLMEQLQ
jgi:DNA (cytosine-5)-methyltransferase 1